MTNTSEIPSFGKELRKFRERKRISQEKLAQSISVNRQTIIAWELSKNPPKDRTRVLELADVLGLDDGDTNTLLGAAFLDPLPLWYVPYPRNPFFTGRDQKLKDLHAQWQQGTTAVVGQMQSVSGLGGVGKTQLAVEYAFRYHEEYQYVLWARAESVEALTASFTGIADLLNLLEKDAQEQAITIEAVKRWLQRQRGWLLILDNADSPALLPDFLPPTVGGHLLITTRAADVSAHIAGLAHPLVVDSLSDDQGALFLLHRSGLLALDATLDPAEMHTWQLALTIAHELGGLPLALDQAGAYLHVTGSGLAMYQQIYLQHRAQLLAERRGADHPEPVATTWNISFRNVEQQNPAAADILRMCAFLAPDAIPETIITQGAKYLGEHLAPVGGDPYLLNQAIEALRAYSLLSREARRADPHLWVHQLVQAVLKDQMGEQEKHQWAARTIRAVEAALPLVKHQMWAQWEQILAHALRCKELIQQEHLHGAEATMLLQQTGWYLTERIRYREAEHLLKLALAITEQEHGLDHLDTVRDSLTLATLYRNQGRYVEAEPLYVRALAISEQQLGDQHPLTAASLSNLAELYRNQGKYAEAEPLYVRALAIYEQQLGAQHPLTATSLNNLAALYYSQGKYAEAEPLHVRALAIREQQVGAQHPDTAQSLNNLAELYRNQGKYAEAEPLYVRALAISEQQLGAQHPLTATSLSNLAELYRNQGKYTEAEPLYVRALAIYEQQLGDQHPDTAISLNNLAALYDSQGKYTEAEPLYVRALAIYEQQVGAQHPLTATSLNNLALLYYSQGKYAEAEPLYVRALAISEQQLGAQHPLTATSLSNLAELYRNQGKYTEAEPLYVRALAIYEQQLGDQHPDTATSLNNLAALYDSQGKYAEAEPLHVRALAIREQQLGAQHPDTATSLNNLAALYYSQGKYAEAEPLYVRALAIYEQQLGTGHPTTQTIQANYIVLLEAMKSEGEADS